MEPISSTVPALISRTQAWCKLAVLIADGLPAPREIRISASVDIVNVDLCTMPDLGAWAARFGAFFDEPFVNGERTLHEATVRSWHGYYLSLKHHCATTSPEPVTEDMSAVREVAEHGKDEPRCPDPECGEPLADIASGAVGHCGRSCAPIEAGAVSE